LSCIKSERDPAEITIWMRYRSRSAVAGRNALQLSLLAGKWTYPGLRRLISAV
jgi:hypothetical protein